MPARSAGSILSHGEQDVAGHLREGREVSEIAAARETPEAAVRKSVDRIEEKTRRALVTLLQSPVVAECARELTPAERREIIAAMQQASNDA